MSNNTIITHDNLKWLYTYLETTEEVEEVASYMKKHDVKIEITNQRVGYASDMKIGEMYFFQGEQNARSYILMYVRYYDKAVELSQSPEYKALLDNMDNLLTVHYLLNKEAHRINIDDLKFLNK